MRFIQKIMPAFVLLSFLSSGMPAVAQAAWQPGKPVELIVGSGPGGGWDLFCRVIQKVSQEENLMPRRILVTNKPGGSGATGWTYLKGKKGQGEFLSASSTLLLLNNITGKSDQTYDQFTVIAALQTEWLAVSVSKDSPYTNGRELFEAMKNDPGKVVLGVSPGLGGNDHISFLMVAQKYGVDPKTIKTVVFPSSASEQIPALLGGHVQVISTGLSEVLEQHKAGNLRIIGVSSEETIDVLPDVKSWKQQGCDIVFPHWRGIIAAPGLSADQIAFWDDFFAKLVATKTWKEEAVKMGWDTFYQPRDEHIKSLAKQTEEYRGILQSVGLVK